MRPAVALPSRVLLTGLTLATLVGCGSSSGVTTQPRQCTSHYELVAATAGQNGLKKLLLHNLDPKITSLRVVPHQPADGKSTVKLLDKDQKVVRSLDMWRKPNGTWVAEQWVPCSTD